MTQSDEHGSAGMFGDWPGTKSGKFRRFGKISNCRLLVFTLVATTLLLVSRVLVVPKRLIHFDSINFAFSLIEFNPGLHQPQPPGYPLFVALSRSIHALVPETEIVFFLAGIVGAIVAIVGLWSLAEAMFPRGTGWFAALLLLFGPTFWLAGATSQVRVFLAAGSVVVAYTAWRAWEPGSPSCWFYATSLSLGAASGFRPDLLIFLFPLLFVAGVRSRRTLPEWVTGLLVLALLVSSWGWPMVVEAGGLLRFCRILQTYLRAQASSSILFGADPLRAWRMAVSACVWNGIGALSWVWAAPIAMTRNASAPWKRVLLFLVVWFCPAFLFHSLIHVGDPDHTLVTAPVICLTGGWVLSQFVTSGSASSLGRRLLAGAVATAINVWLFFGARSEPARASTYHVIAAAARANEAVFAALRQLQTEGPVFVISDGSTAMWRYVSYYFPEIPVLVLDGTLEAPGNQALNLFFQNRRSRPPVSTGDEFVLPRDHKIVLAIWLPPDRLANLGRDVPLTQMGPLVFFESKAGTRIRVGAHRFRVADCVPVS